MFKTPVLNKHFRHSDTYLLMQLTTLTGRCHYLLMQKPLLLMTRVFVKIKQWFDMSVHGSSFLLAQLQLHSYSDVRKNL